MRSASASTVATKSSSSGGILSWLTGGSSSTSAPLEYPLSGVDLPPPLPDHVEPGKTKISTLPNGVKIASETSTVCRLSSFSLCSFVFAISLFKGHDLVQTYLTKLCLLVLVTRILLLQ